MEWGSVADWIGAGIGLSALLGGGALGLRRIGSAVRKARPQRRQRYKLTVKARTVQRDVMLLEIRVDDTDETNRVWVEMSSALGGSAAWFSNSLTEQFRGFYLLGLSHVDGSEPPAFAGSLYVMWRERLGFTEIAFKVQQPKGETQRRYKLPISPIN